MKNHIKTCIVLLLSVLLLVSCSRPSSDVSEPTTGTSYSASSIPNLESGGNAPEPDNHELIVPIVEECRVSSKRTGTKRQGVSVPTNGFECTDTGSYWMLDNWLLYSDHGSDTVIKLCGRPDCTHSGRDCNAYFRGCSNICYYDGYLYTFGDDGLYRINLDGSDRLLVFDLPAFKVGLHENYKGRFSTKIWNGIVSFELTKLDENGDLIGTSFYYKLDGSMETAKETDVPVDMMNTDGDTFIGCIGYKAVGDGWEYTYGIWDPATDTTTEFFRDSTWRSEDYYGSEAIYRIEDGVVYEYVYSTGVTDVLFDTGLEGTHLVRCYPDVIVVSDYSDDKTEDMNLYFYDWNFNDLGSVHIDYPFNSALHSVVCGETHERFMLSADVDYAPRYYIEKSDFGTGNITIHEYEWDFESIYPI